MSLRLSSVGRCFSLLATATFFLLPSVSALGIENENTFPLKLFITVGIIAALFILLAFSQDLPFFNIAASVMIFFLGFVLLNGSVAYTNGDFSEYYVYGSNFTAPNGSATYHWDYGNMPKFSAVELDNPGTQFLFHTERETQYVYWDNDNSHLLGWLLMFVSVILFTTTLFSLFSRGDDY